jgi:hypothetical protein
MIRGRGTVDRFSEGGNRGGSVRADDVDDGHALMYKPKEEVKT